MLVTVLDRLFNTFIGNSLLDSVSFDPIELGIKIGAYSEMSPCQSVQSAAFAQAVCGFSATSYDLPFIDGNTRKGTVVVSGATNNRVDVAVVGATVGGGGGWMNGADFSNYAGGFWSTVGGGASNQVTGQYAMSSDGGGNSATADYTTVSGGWAG